MATTRIATQPRVSRSKKSANSPHEVQPEVQINDPVLAQARAVADTIRQLERGRIPKGGVKLPLFNKDGTDFAFPPPLAPHVPKPAPTSCSTDSSLPDLARHRRKCVVCNHADREEIEEQFVQWRHPGDIAHDFQIEEARYIRRHAQAVGLYARRRENYLFTLENLLERGDEIELTASAYIKAVRAYACMCDTVRWTEPAIRVIGIRDHSAPANHDSHVAPSSPGQEPGTCSGQPDGAPRSMVSRAWGISPAGVGTSLLNMDLQNESVEAPVSPSSLQQAAIPDSAQFACRSLHRDVPSAPLHHSQKTKDAEASPDSSLATDHSLALSEVEGSLPSNRPSPRLETGVSDRKQRKEASSNRP